MNSLNENTNYTMSNLEEVEEEIDENETLSFPMGKAKDIKYFIRFMRRNNLSDNTIQSYSNTVRHYFTLHKVINKNSLLAYKSYLLENYSPNTVNVRINGMNKYLEYIHKSSLSLKCIHIQQKPFLENVISDSDYRIFTRKLKKDGRMTYYFLVRYMACTGARVGEVIRFKVEHVVKGHMDIYSKGGKLRRLYIPYALQKETLTWMSDVSIEEGYIFLNKNGIQISERGISKQLKTFAEEYGGIPLETVYPHSFRHRFALNFIERNKDISLLADLLGHSSISTTMIYTRMSSLEQRKIIEQTVNW